MSTSEPNNTGKSKGINSKTGLWLKRDAVKGKFTGVRKEALDKLSSTLNKLAKYDKK